jgi:AhpD family alkylhydroperoxidase
MERRTAMKLDARTASLIAVGASVSANCQPCLEINTARAAKYGAEAPEIADAVEVGRKVRAGAAEKLDAFATKLGAISPNPRPGAEPACGCGA